MSADSYTYLPPGITSFTYASPAQGPPGAQGGGVQSVATVAGLSTMPDSTYGNGQLALVGTQRSWWSLDVASTASLAANQVVATLSGVGRWVRQPWVHGSQTLQTDRGVDPANSTGVASDENAGTAAAPLLTWAELYRRVPSWTGLRATVTIAALSDSTDADRWICNGTVDTGAIIVTGTRQVIRTGTLSAASGINRATGAVNTITSSVGAAWPVQTVRRYDNKAFGYIRITSGANAGIRAPILEDLGGGVAAVGVWQKPTSGNFFVAATGFTLVGTETYEWYNPVLMPITSGRVDQADAGTPGNLIARKFEDCRFPIGSDNIVGSCIAGTAALFFLNCQISALISESTQLGFLGCSINTLGLNLWHCQIADFRGGVVNGISEQSYIQLNASILSIANDTVFMGGSLLAVKDGSVTYINDCAIRKNTGAYINYESGAFVAYPGGSIHFGGQNTLAAHTLYGTSNTVPLVNVLPGGRAMYDTSTTFQAVTSATSFILNTRTALAVPRADTGVYTSSISLTFANLVASYASTGFNGSVIDPESGASFVLRR